MADPCTSPDPNSTGSDDYEKELEYVPDSSSDESMNDYSEDYHSFALQGAVNQSPPKDMEHLVVELSETPSSSEITSRAAADQDSEEPSNNNSSLAINAPSASLKTLPDDLLLVIFNGLPRETKKIIKDEISPHFWRLLRSDQQVLRIRDMTEVVFPLRQRGFTALTTVIIDHHLTSPTSELTSTAGGRVVYVLTDTHLKTLGTDFPRLLTSLTLIACDKITSESLIFLVRTCPLAYLRLEACFQLDDDGFIEVATEGARNALRHLDLAFCQVSLLGINTLRTIVRTVTAVHCPPSSTFHS